MAWRIASSTKTLGDVPAACQLRPWLNPSSAVALRRASDSAGPRMNLPPKSP
jgi:hypothetical protein